MTERTFSIIKPDATRRNLTGAINAVIEGAGLRIVAQRRIKLTEEQAKKFYEVHAERPFYGELVSQMIAEPVVVQVLPSERLARRGKDVIIAVPVTFPDDALGAEIDVPTPLGDKVRVKVPAGSTDGKMLRVRGMGSPSDKGDAGSLLVRLKLIVPSELSTQQTEALEKFAALDGGRDPRAELFA
jgi:nucleoside diphosphate kinase